MRAKYSMHVVNAVHVIGPKLNRFAALTVVQVDAAGGRGQELVQRHWGGRLGLGGRGGTAHLLSVVAGATLRVMVVKLSSSN